MLQLVYAYCGTKTVDGQNEYAFGLKDGLPWGHIKRDMQNFAKRTKDTVVIMGAKTWMSMPTALKGRKCIVVQDMNRPFAQAKDGLFPDGYMSPEEFKAFLDKTNNYYTNHGGIRIRLLPNDNYSVIGGKRILETAQPYADRIVQTSIQKKHRVNSDVTLDMSFISYPSWENAFQMVETSWVRCDELTSLTETVYERV
ncbi:dihydrofolate reductase [Enterobacter phage vB_EclM-UFV01]|nr:dihydrofolate reductase [Enterobacter phage vB_EclM-UFV01]